MKKHWKIGLEVPDAIDRRILMASLLPAGWTLQEADDVVFLETPAFAHCVDSSDVYRLATDMVHRLDLAARLTDPTFVSVAVGHVREVTPEGEKIAVHLFDSAVVTGRARAFASTGEPSPAIRDALAGLEADVLAQAVAELVDDRDKPEQLRWVHLYIAVEVIGDEMRDHGFSGDEPEVFRDAGFATKQDVRDVKQSAQVHRHGENMGPQKLSLEVASGIVRKATLAWLHWKGQLAQPAP